MEDTRNRKCCRNSSRFLMKGPLLCIYLECFGSLSLSLGHNQFNGFWLQRHCHHMNAWLVLAGIQSFEHCSPLNDSREAVDSPWYSHNFFKMTNSLKKHSKSPHSSFLVIYAYSPTRPAKAPSIRTEPPLTLSCWEYCLMTHEWYLEIIQLSSSLEIFRSLVPYCLALWAFSFQMVFSFSDFEIS